jgi:hypothetical protein
MARSAAKAGETLGDRQWVFGLENALDKIPTAVEARQLDGTEEARRRSERVREQARAGAVERYSHTGEWDAARWGPPPAEQMGPAMDRPAIVANGAPR